MHIFHNAKTIWTQNSQKINTYGAFQTFFKLDKFPRVLSLRISVQNRYAVYINGHLLPAQSCADYPFCRYYDELTIPTQWLQEGENNLSILAYCQNDDSFLIRAGDGAELIFALFADNQYILGSGENTICSHLTGYKAGPDIELMTVPLSYTIHYNAQFFDEWYLQDHRNDPRWSSATILKKNHQYNPRPIPQMIWEESAPAYIVAQGVFRDADGCNTAADRVQRAWLSQRYFYQMCSSSTTQLPACDGLHFYCNDPADGIYLIVDMKHDVSGYFQLEIDTPNSCLIDIGYGEHLDDLRVRTAVNGRNFALTYHTKPGRNSFLCSLKRLGCRFLQLHIRTENFCLHYAGLRPTVYPIQYIPAPNGLTPLQQKIYDVSIDTLRLCMHEHYEDTPWREQALYALDSRNQMLCGYYTFGEYALCKESLRLLALGMRDDGLLELCAPAKIDSVIPSFSLFWVVALAEYAEHSNDLVFAEEMLPIAQQILQTFRDNKENGLIKNLEGYWNFFEWTDLLNGLNMEKTVQITRPGTEAPINAVYALALLKLSQLSSTLKQTQLSTDLYEEHQLLKEDFNRIFWNAEISGYALGIGAGFDDFCPELLQALTVYAKLCPDTQTEDLLCNKIAHEQYWPQSSLSTSIFKYEVLLEHPKYHDLMLDQINRVWGNMLYQGATSFWETDIGASDFENAGSLCHGWSAVPAFVYQKLHCEGYL